jgi:hypothetical protein
MRTPLARPLLAAALAVAALAVPAAPASADGCQPKVTWTEHLIYQGPPGPNICVMVPTVIMGDCT